MHSTHPLATTEQSSYGKFVEELLTSWATPEMFFPLENLFKATGCHCMERCTVQGWVLVQPRTMDAAHESIIREALYKIAIRRAKTEWVDASETMSLLEGLSKNGRWRDCLLSIDATYSLAAMLVEFAGIEPCVDEIPPINGDLARLVAPRVHEIILSWLLPGAPALKKCPSAVDLTRMLFGDAWVEFTIYQESQDFRHIPNIIRANRPPLLPGLVPEQSYPAHIGLPDIGS